LDRALLRLFRVKKDLSTSLSITRQQQRLQGPTNERSNANELHFQHGTRLGAREEINPFKANFTSLNYCCALFRLQSARASTRLFLKLPKNVLFTLLTNLMLMPSAGMSLILGTLSVVPFRSSLEQNNNNKKKNKKSRQRRRAALLHI
jgi:hypothetical protein